MSTGKRENRGPFPLLLSPAAPDFSHLFLFFVSLHFFGFPLFFGPGKKTQKSFLLARDLLGHPVGLLDHLLDVADHVEGGLGEVVVLLFVANHFFSRGKK